MNIESRSDYELGEGSQRRREGVGGGKDEEEGEGQKRGRDDAALMGRDAIQYTWEVQQK